MEPWLNILPGDLQRRIFLQIENRLNKKGSCENGISMQVPFVTIDCFKERSIKSF
jgi:hypothetical protein